MKSVTTKLIIVLLLSVNLVSQAQTCDPNTPFFQVDLSAAPDTEWSSPMTQRDGNCCATTNPDKCIEFEITLHPDAEGIIFQITDGALPPGALFYQINCGPAVAVGEPICINTPGPHTITFCKPGNNTNEYTISSIGAPITGPDLTVNDGCTGFIYARFYDESTISWNSVFPGNPGDYNSFLSCNTGCDTAYVTPSGAFPAYIDYEVCGIALSGCSMFTVCDTVRVYINNAINAQINPVAPTICTPGGQVNLTANSTGGLAPYTYNWNTGQNTSSIAVGAGTYYVDIFDQTGCPAGTDTVVVSEVTAPITVDAGNPQLLCWDTPNANIAGTITGANGAVWTGAGTFSTNDSNLINAYTPTPTEISNNSYTLYLQTYGPGSCPSVIDSIRVDLTSITNNYNFSVQPVSCHGLQDGTIDITAMGANPPYTYSINGGAPQTTGYFIALDSGTHQVQVTNAIGCDTIISLYVAMPAPLSSNLNAIQHVSCNSFSDGSLGISIQGGTAPYNVSWNIPQSGTSITNLAAGNYDGLITDANGCLLNVSHSIIEPAPLLIQGTLTHPSCQGANDGSIDITVTGGTPGYQYIWKSGETNEDLINLIGDIYTVTVMDQNSCVTTVDFDLYDPDRVQLSVLPNDTICPGDVITVTGTPSGGFGPYSYNWVGFPNNSNTLSVPVASSRYFTLEVTDINGCTERDSAYIHVSTQNPNDIRIINNSAYLCSGTDVSLNGQYTGSNPQVSFDWNISPINNLSLGTINITQNTQVILTATDECNNTIADTIDLFVYPLPQIDVQNYPDTICPGQSVLISNALHNPAYNYTWTIGGLLFTDSTFTHTFGQSGDYPVSVTVTDTNGCSASNSTANIHVFSQPDALFTFTPNVVYETDATVEFNNLTLGGTDYIWDFGNGNQSNLEDPVVFFEGSGVYPVFLTATNQYGCIDTITLNVIVKEGYNVYIPNAFTPGGDTYNNTFQISGYNISSENFELLIFNRWGELIFESHNPSIGWDGTYAGTEAQSDVYVYKVSLQSLEGDSEVIRGHVTLIK